MLNGLGMLLDAPQFASSAPCRRLSRTACSGGVCVVTRRLHGGPCSVDSFVQCTEMPEPAVSARLHQAFVVRLLGAPARLRSDLGKLAQRRRCPEVHQTPRRSSVAAAVQPGARA